MFLSDMIALDKKEVDGMFTFHPRTAVTENIKKERKKRDEGEEVNCDRQCEDGTVDVEVGGTTVLCPCCAVPENITDIMWKHGADKAADWFGEGIECFRQFKGRCELNIMTGELTINHLTLSHSGFYSAEINGNKVNTAQLRVMSRVPKPSVSIQCDDAMTYCLLTCEGNSSVPEADKYLWNKEKEHSSSMKVLNITKENKEPRFSCEIKNTVSSSRSDPVPNPYHQDPLQQGNLLWILAVVLVILLTVIVAVVLNKCKKPQIQNISCAWTNMRLEQKLSSININEP